MVSFDCKMKRGLTLIAIVAISFILIPLPMTAAADTGQVYTEPIGPWPSGTAPLGGPGVEWIPETPEGTGALPQKSLLPEPAPVATSSSPHEANWDPGDPFDNWGWVKINKLRDVNTGVEEPPSGMPPNEYQVVNVSVVNKCPGPAPRCDPAMDVIKFAVINMTVWFPKDPIKPQHGEVRMWNKNGSANSNEWWGEIGGGGVDGKVWPLPKCARVYWTIKIWDVANRMVNSSNSAAATTIQNYSVEGACNWPPGAQYQQYIDIWQSPMSATDPGPKYPSETKPGGNMSVATPVKVRVLSKKYIQMPWIILYVNQTTADGDFNQSWLVGVRGYCYDYSVSPGVCDVSNGGSPNLPIRNGTEFVFDIPGFYAGTFLEYAVVAVDYTVWDYNRDPDYQKSPWDYVAQRTFCTKKPASCLQSPNYYYHIPKRPPPPSKFVGRLAAQLLKEVYSPSGKKLGLEYISEGCARFENDTWRSQTFKTNEYGLVLSPTIEVNLTPPDFIPIEFRVVASWPCLSNQTVVEAKNIPNVDGPDYTINATWIIIFANPKQVFYAETIVGWHGMDWAIVYAIGIIGFIAPTLFFGLRWFTRRKEMEDAKKAETEQRFKI